MVPSSNNYEHFQAFYKYQEDIITIDFVGQMVKINDF